MQRACTLFILLLFLSYSGEETKAQQTIPGSVPKIIHFKLDRDRLILPVTIGDKRLRIILDSGMPWEGFYLFHKDVETELNLRNPATVNVGGAGSGEASTASMFDSVTVKIDQEIFPQQLIVISRSEATRDFLTDGVTGRTVFSYPVVGIDFDSSVMTLSESLPILDSDWLILPLHFNENDIPFLTLPVAILPNDTLTPMEFYIDLATSEVIEMLVKKDIKWAVPGGQPKEVLGTGLSGDVEGFRGYVSKIRIGGNELLNVKATYPDADSRSKQQSKADGILGCGFMKHFNFYIDRHSRLMYLKPSKYFIIQNTK